MTRKGKRASEKTNLIKWDIMMKGQKLNMKLSNGSIHVGSFIKVREDGRIAVRLDTGEKFRFEPDDESVQVSILADRCKTKGCQNNTHPNENYCETCKEEIFEQDMTLASTPPRKKPKTFYHYGIEWDERRVNFRFTTDEGLYFYGLFRKTRNANSQEELFAIDLFARKDEQEFTCESIFYEKDPRENEKSLNADIAAAAQKWFFMCANDNIKNIERLKKLVAHPTIHFRRIESIDRTLLKLREFRDTAIRCGGRRLVELHGDDPKQPTIYLTIDVSTQAFAMKGKVPSLEKAAVFDRVIRREDSSGKNKGALLTNKPDMANVKAMIERLDKAETEDERRSIRSSLRKMGHKGGARALRAMLQAEKVK